MATARRPCGPCDLTVELRILGTLNVVDGERSVEFAGPKPKALLAMLVIHANQVVSADRLVDALWAEHPQPTETDCGYDHAVGLARAASDPEAFAEAWSRGRTADFKALLERTRRAGDLSSSSKSFNTRSASA